jgi:hypothetical protein
MGLRSTTFATVFAALLLAGGCDGRGGLKLDGGTPQQQHPPSCSSAVARVAALCPQVALQDACSSPRPDCVATCMAEVQTCRDVLCSFCQACDCAGDPYGACYQACATADAASP